MTAGATGGDASGSAANTAFIGFGGETLSHMRLAERRRRLAAHLVAEGLEPGRPFAVMSRDPVRVYWSLQISLHLGAPLLPLSPDLSRKRVASLFDDCGVIQGLADGELRSLLPAPTRHLPIDWLDDSPTAASEPVAETPARGRIQIFITTSGTSGAPRAVGLTGTNLTASVGAALAVTPLRPGDRWLACLPLHHIGGLSIPLRCQAARAAVVLHPGFNACRVLEDLGRHRVSHLSLVPPLLERLLETAGGRPPPPSLRAVLIGGGPLSTELCRRAVASGWPVCPTYGMSETASQIATLCGAGGDWERGDVGPPVPETRVSILDQDGISTEDIGRIHVSGPTLMAGYANREGLTGVGLADGGFVTGDLGRIDARGHLHVLGRADEMLVSGGSTIHPNEVEDALLACPQIHAVGVTALPDPTWGDIITACVVSSADEEGLAAWSRANLASGLRPRRFLVLQELPYLASGKPDRLRLRRLALENAKSIRPRTAPDSA